MDSVLEDHPLTGLINRLRMLAEQGRTKVLIIGSRPSNFDQAVLTNPFLTFWHSTDPKVQTKRHIPGDVAYVIMTRFNRHHIYHWVKESASKAEIPFVFLPSLGEIKSRLGLMGFLPNSEYITGVIRTHADIDCENDEAEVARLQVILRHAGAIVAKARILRELEEMRQQRPAKYDLVVVPTEALLLSPKAREVKAWTPTIPLDPDMLTEAEAEAFQAFKDDLDRMCHEAIQKLQVLPRKRRVTCFARSLKQFRATIEQC